MIKVMMQWGDEFCKHYIGMEPLNHNVDETLPNFIKKMHQERERKKTKSNDQSQSMQNGPKEANQMEVREP
jgi:hypothetical protein